MDESGGRESDPSLNLPSVDALRTVFQPVVELASGAVVGYEALVRGPGRAGQEQPAALFAAARAAGRTRELDWAARWSAVQTARGAGFGHPLALFVNAEPEALGGPPGGGLEAWKQMSDLRCYAEITERALTDAPGELLRATDAVRSQDWGIALDDIGANPESLALMPMLQPDVLKLDLRLLRDHGQLQVARTLHAVLTQAADTGATVVAEGIEDEQQRDLALGLGVRLGQGYFLGQPGALPGVLPKPAAPVGLLQRVIDRAVAPSPYTMLNETVPARRVTEVALGAVWAQIEQQAAHLQPPPVLFAAFADRAGFDAAAGRLTELSAQLPLAAALGPAEVVTDTPRLRTQVLTAGDPAIGDVALVIVSPHFAAALAARPVVPSKATPGPTTGSPRDYDLVVSFGRAPVVRAATAMLARLDQVAGAPTWLTS